MRKKNVLFIMPSLFIGGAERSLLGLLDYFDYSRYNVNLFLFRHEGEYLQYIPENVNLLPEIKEYGTIDVPISNLIKSSKIMFGIFRTIGKLALHLHTAIKKEPAGVWMTMQYNSRFLLPLLPKIPGEYDLAVMFLGIGDVLAKKVNSRVKVTWNHTDYTTLYPDTQYDLQIYKKIDYIASVSDLCTKQFLQIHPSLEDKTVTVENMLSIELLRAQAKEKTNDMTKPENGVVLLSIGRYCEAKNFDNVPFICKHLIDMGITVKWYIIGYGNDEELIRNKIREAGVENDVILLGKRSNPYPYVKSCDIYVQPSRYEGKSVAVREAQILNKPVVITEYPTSHSQLTDNYDGVIVPMDNKGCAEGIARVIKDKDLQNRLIRNTKENDYTNSSEIQKIYDFMEEVNI